MNPEHIVPGHGPVVNREGMQEVRDYLSGIVTAAGAPAGAPLPRALRRWEGSLTLEENLTFTRRWIAVRDTRK